LKYKTENIPYKYLQHKYYPQLEVKLFLIASYKRIGGGQVKLHSFVASEPDGVASAALFPEKYFGTSQIGG
jgi:hypothetical protein